LLPQAANMMQPSNVRARNAMQFDKLNLTLILKESKRASI